MKRWAVAVLSILLSGGIAIAANCQSSQSGNCSAASTWGGTACNPTSADNIWVVSGHTVYGDCGNLSIHHMTVEGTLNMAPGKRVFTVASVDGDAINVLGTLNLANGTGFTFTANSGTPGIYSNSANGNGAIISENVDLGPLRLVMGIAISTSSGACISGDRWTVTTDQPTTGLAAGDIVQVATGKLKGRGFEIAGVTASTLTLCPSFPDGSSLGPRFTPHQSTAATYVDAWVDPPLLVGDRFWAWQPPIIKKTGTAKWILANTGNNARFEFIGADMSGWDTLWARCGAAGTNPVIFSHVNLHDFASSNNALWIFGALGANDGCNKPLVSWPIMHDGTQPDTHSNLAYTYDNAASTMGGGMFIDGTFYRLKHNNININFSGTATAMPRITVARNDFFDLDSQGGECSAIEVDTTTDSSVRSNGARRLSTECSGILQSPAGTPSGNLFEGNFLYGGKVGMEVIAGKALCRNNFIGYTQQHALWCWQADQNYIWYTNHAGREGMIRAVLAEGNLLDGLNIADAGGSPHAVWGFEDASTQFGNAATVRKYRNNVCRGLRNDGVFGPGCVFIQSTDHDIDVLHNVMDCADAVSCGGVAYLYTATAQTFNIKDNVTINCPASGYAAQSNAAAGATANLVNLTRFPSTCPAAFGTLGAEWDVKTGEVNRDPLFVNNYTDWNYQFTSLERTAGAVPAGSPIGVRARRFDSLLLPPYYRDQFTTNGTVNEPVTDGDHDGFLSFLRADTDSPDACPFIADMMNGTNNGGACKNAAATAGKTFLKGGN